MYVFFYVLGDYLKNIYGEKVEFYDSILELITLIGDFKFVLKFVSVC